MGDTLLTGGEGQGEGAAPPAGGEADPRAWLPSEFRADPTFEPIKDVAGLAKSYKHAASMVGLDKGHVLRLPAREDAAEWGDVWAKLGRPEAPDGYDVAAPEGLDDDALKAFRETAHGLGLSQKQAAELMGFYGQRLAGMRSAAEELAATQAMEAEKALKAEWGTAFQQRLHLANRLVAETGGEELRAAINEAGLGRNPVFLRWLSDMATRGAEPDALKGGGGGLAKGMTPAEAQAEIAGLEASEEWRKVSLDRDAPGRDVLLAKRARLYALAYPGQAA